MTTSRRKIRELALQVLFAWDAHGAPDREMASQLTQDASDDPITRQRATDAAAGAWENRGLADTWLEKLAPQWPPRRQPSVDRNILRLAVWELGRGEVPVAVAIDEAVSLAKRYASPEAATLVNGVLGRIAREQGIGR